MKPLSDKWTAPVKQENDPGFAPVGLKDIWVAPATQAKGIETVVAPVTAKGWGSAPAAKADGWGDVIAPAVKADENPGCSTVEAKKPGEGAGAPSSPWPITYPEHAPA